MPTTHIRPSAPRPTRWKRTVALAVVAVLAVGVAACGSTDEQSASSTTGDPATAAGNLVQAGEPGPFEVGVRTIEATDPNDPSRRLPIDVWYPVEADATAGLARHDYEFIPGLGYTSEVSWDDAPPAPGPFPFVVYSHGNGGFRWVSTFLTEFLASKGFVVAAVDHTGNTALDEFTGQSLPQAQVAQVRPGDVTATIDAVLALSNDSSDPLSGRVDADRIGVTGHSFGGYTTLAIAGGAPGPDGDLPPDERVKALVALAPYTTLLNEDQLGSITVPLMVISGTLDTTTPIDPHTEAVWSAAGSRPLVRVDITDAAHNSFTDLCQLRVAVGERPDVPEAIGAELERQSGQACGAEVLDYLEVQRITRSYAAAFLIDELDGSNQFAGVLDCGDAPPSVVCRVRN